MMDDLANNGGTGHDPPLERVHTHSPLWEESPFLCSGSAACGVASGAVVLVLGAFASEGACCGAA